MKTKKQILEAIKLKELEIELFKDNSDSISLFTITLKSEIELLKWVLK